MEVDWANEDNVEWFPYNAGNGVVLYTTARDVPGRKRVVHDKVISRHFNAVKVHFLVDQLFSLAVEHDTAMRALGPNRGAEISAEVIKKREPEECVEVWDVGDRRSSNERGPWALERVRDVCEPLLLPMPTTVAEVQEIFEDEIRVYADLPKLEIYLMIKEAVLIDAEKDLEKQSADSETRVQELRTVLKDSRVEVSRAKEVFLSDEDLVSKLDSSQKKLNTQSKTILFFPKSQRMVLMLSLTRGILSLICR